MLGLRGEDYRVWADLYWHQGANGSAWPSQEAIAAELGLSVRYTKQVLKRLAGTGWLEVKWPNGPGRGKDHHKEYVLTCPDGESASGSVPAEKGNSGSPFTPDKRGTPEHLLPNEKGNRDSPFEAEKGNCSSEKRGTVVPPNTVIRTLKSNNTPLIPPLGAEGGSNNRDSIGFDYQTGRFSGTESALATWRAAYPHIDVAQEIRKAGAWLIGNRDRSKRRIGHFLVNWLRRADTGVSNGRATRRQTSERTGGNEREQHCDEDGPSGGGLVFTNEPPLRELREPAAVG